MKKGFIGMMGMLLMMMLGLAGCQTQGAQTAEVTQDTVMDKKAQVQYRVRQVINLYWTPRQVQAPYDRFYDYQGYIPGEKPERNYTCGKQWKGVVYSQSNQLDKYVGLDVGIHTYMTAINNPYSVMYTENIGSTTQRSAYGKKYNSGAAGAFYGIDCSSLVCYALGFKRNIPTMLYADLCAKGSLKEVGDHNDWSKIEAMDFLWMQGHTRLVYDVTRDDSGHIADVWIAEATVSHPISPDMTSVLEHLTAKEFDERLKAEADGTASYLKGVKTPCKFYRNVNLPQIDTIHFTRFDNMTAETHFDYNDDICPNLGDSCCISTGEIIVLNYNLKGEPSLKWKGIELYRFGKLKDTYTINPDTIGYKLDSLEQGVYRARMTDGQGEFSDFVDFEVLEPKLGNDGKGHMTFEVTGGKAVLVYFHAPGRSMHYHILTDEEVKNGRMNKTINEVLRANYSKAQMERVSAHLLVQGRYGRAKSGLLYPFKVARN